MVTNSEGCAASVFVIVSLTIGRYLRDQRFSHLLASLSREKNVAPPLRLNKTGAIVSAATA